MPYFPVDFNVAAQSARPALPALHASKERVSDGDLSITFFPLNCTLDDEGIQHHKGRLS